MFRDNIKFDVCKLADDAGIIDVVESNVICKDSTENARRDYTITIVGYDRQAHKKKVFFNVTAWEEIVHNEKD